MMWHRREDGQAEAEAALEHAKSQREKVSMQQRDTNELMDRIELYVVENRIVESIKSTLRRRP